MNYSFEIGKREDTAALYSLWQLCFPEDADFTEFYFDKMYSPEAARIIRCGDSIAAALYVFPYSFADCNGKILNSYYIYGVGTNPNMRGQGMASRLIEETLNELREKRADLCMLVPQNQGLFAFYERLGFTPAFGLSSWDYEFKRADTAEIKVAQKEDTEKLNKLYEKVLSGTPHVLRSQKEWKLLIEELTLAKGSIYMLKNFDDICAFCTYTEENGVATAAEVIATDDECKVGLLNNVLGMKNKEKIRCYEFGEALPYGAFYPLTSNGEKAMSKPMNAYMNLMHS